ncbi:MAG: TonB-dependent receptor [Ignavibacteria bacterium]|nr:TonB-dependent receptor [Ignavibacteria bacterium]
MRSIVVPDPKPMIVLVLFLLLTLPAHLEGQTQPSATVAGLVTDRKGDPLELVNVRIVGTLDGDATDRNGRFSFRTSKLGFQRLTATMVGYNPVSADLNLSPDDSVYLVLALEETFIKLSEVNVQAGAYTTGDELKGTTLRSLEVLTTPGAAADIFRAVQTFPGVFSVDEGSGLFVRGGDVSEIVVLLDQATVFHPYRYETPTGGVFGTIPPFLVRGTYFSTGGFSARYGNALSGILAMESLDLPRRLSYSGGLGLAAGTLGANIPVVPGKLGVRFSANQSFTDLMFRVNGVRHQFTITPRGHDANLSIIYRYSESGQLKLFNFMNSNRIGVRVDEPSFEGQFVSEETSRLHNLQWKDLVRDWVVKGSVSYSSFATERALGNMNMKPSDAARKLRFDADRSLTNDLRLAVGIEYESLDNSFSGTIPTNPEVLDPQADVYLLEEQYKTTRGGAYVELEAQLSRRLIGSAGVRVDHYGIARQTVGDPRLTFQYFITKETIARLSCGLYSQFPQPMLYNRASGNPQLLSQRAQHLILGIEHTDDQLMLRVEGYQKTYDDLVLREKTTRYANLGDGLARGVDCFLKYGAFLQTPVNGWISYSYLHSRRLQARNLVDRYEYETAPSSFDITHNLTVVAKAQVIQFLSASLTFRYATGRPVTPVIGAVHHADRGFYEPISGPINSERLPEFIRLDGGLSYFLPFGESNAATFYLAVSNLLNRANPIRYEYSPDYSERRLKTSEYRRFFYFGVAVSFGSLDTGI